MPPVLPLTVARGLYIPIYHWWNYGFVGAIAVMALTRTHLLNNNLFDVTTSAEYASLSTNCTLETQSYRSLDGTCNNLENPAMGALNIRFGRNIPLANSSMPSLESILYPNPRVVANTLLARTGGRVVKAETINLLAAAWIQFQTHDWFSHGSIPDLADNIKVPILEDDDLYGQQNFMLIGRTLKDPTFVADGVRPESYRNFGTHWWDLSQLYGTTKEISDKIRAHKGGKLNVDAKTGLLPFGEDNLEITGLNDNWWTGLSIMHNIWTREHNQIASMFSEKYPDWDDDRIYHQSRLVLCALNAKIHTIEWTPALLNNQWTKTAMHSNWFGMLPKWIQNLLPSGFKSHILTGIVKGNTDFYGVNFTLTEEFISVYRFHSLLPEELTVKSHKTNVDGKTYQLVDTAFGENKKVVENEDYKDLIHTFGTANPGALCLNNFPTALTNLKKPGMPFAIDIATIDIVRDRERGVPRYRAFRKLMGMTDVKSFEEISDNKETVEKLKLAYESVDDVDLLIGSLSESPRPEGFAFGDTAFGVFILMASRRLMTDRFFTTDFNEKTYTAEGMEWISKNTFGDVISRSFPELKDSISSVGNSFFPWKFGGAAVKKEWQMYK